MHHSFKIFLAYCSILDPIPVFFIIVFLTFSLFIPEALFVCFSRCAVCVCITCWLYFSPPTLLVRYPSPSAPFCIVVPGEQHGAMRHPTCISSGRPKHKWIYDGERQIHLCGCAQSQQAQIVALLDVYCFCCLFTCHGCSKCLF